MKKKKNRVAAWRRREGKQMDKGVRMGVHTVFGERLKELIGNGSPVTQDEVSSPWKVTRDPYVQHYLMSSTDRPS